MEAAGAAQEAGKNLEMTRTIILFVDAARGCRHYAIAKSGVRITLYGFFCRIACSSCAEIGFTIWGPLAAE